MSLTSTLLKAGALYALGRYATNIKPEDVEKFTGISGDDLKRFGLDRADAVLSTIGLQRAATVPSSTVLVLSGFAAGALVGAGVTFLFFSEQGKEVRTKIGEFFVGRSGGDEADPADASESGNGEAKVNA